MRMIKTNNNQCVAASLAMVLGYSLDTTLELLGHDGLEIINPHMEPPNCYRSFHPQELVDVCDKQGHALVMVDLLCYMNHGGHIISHLEDQVETRKQYYLSRYDSIIYGTLYNDSKKGHAVAWNYQQQLVYDPRGYTYLLTDKSDFQARQIFTLHRKQVNEE